MCSRYIDDTELLSRRQRRSAVTTHRKVRNDSSCGHDREISSDEGKILVNSIKPRPSTNIGMNGKVLEVNQLKYLGSTQTKDATSLKERLHRSKHARP